MEMVRLYMRLLPTKQCQAGMRLGKGIYNEEGIILLGVDVTLTDHLINRLVQLGIDYLYVQDPNTDDIDIKSPISDQTRFKAITEIRTSFRSLADQAASKRAVKNPTLGKSFNNVLQMIIDDLSEHKEALIMLTDINVMNNYLYNHSLNVAIITLSLGITHGYSKNDLFALGLGAILHDIGKTKIQMDLLTQNRTFTIEEFKEVQKHTVLGYQLLKDEPNIPLLSAHCAFQHHERIDGSGYPRGIKGDEIHDFAKWIAIADSYDAMTNHRPFRNAMLPHEAMEVLYGSAGTLYDRKKVAVFRDNVAIYPLGLTVKLNTGEKGVVTHIHPNYPQRPTVRIFEEADGKLAQPNYEIDLSQKHTILIENVNSL
jgi:HD-GYP domain-containing protein (c-di-GMP phosphodiesterase class II)